MSLRLFLLFSALLLHRVLGDTVQRIVDDQLGDLVTGQQVSSPQFLEAKQALTPISQIQYSAEWSQGNGCSYCTAKPSPGSAMNGTFNFLSLIFHISMLGIVFLVS